MSNHTAIRTPHTQCCSPETLPPPSPLCAHSRYEHVGVAMQHIMGVYKSKMELAHQEGSAKVCQRLA